jgi:hypothetical protein
MKETDGEGRRMNRLNPKASVPMDQADAASERWPR